MKPFIYSNLLYNKEKDFWYSVIEDSLKEEYE